MSRGDRRVGAVRLFALAVVALVLTACGGGGGAAVPATTARTEHPAGFVDHDGRNFTVDGRPIPMVGMNVYNAASTGNCWYDMRSRFSATLDTISRDSAGAADVVRVWFFQNLATRDGRRDWTELDRVVATAKARGFRVVAVLTDQWGACEGAAGRDGGYKNRAWYESGYRRVAPGAVVPYRDWAREVTARYRDEPTVAMWSLVNEAEAAESRSGACRASGPRALRDFTVDMTAVVRSVDPAHLLGLGTIGEGQCGASGSEFARLHDVVGLDVCEFHDYDEPDTPVPGDETNGLAARIAQCSALGRPVLVGEAGIDADEVGGPERRAALLRAKLDAQRRAGVAGFLLWGWVAPDQTPSDAYGIGPGDPVLRALDDSS